MNNLQYSSSTIKLAKALSILWPIYYFLVFTIGTNETYAQIILWGGLFLPASLSVLLYMHTRPKFPQEIKILFLLILLCLIGSINVLDFDLFQKRLRFLLQFLIIMLSVSEVVRVSHEVRWFFVGFVAISVYILQNSFGGLGQETFSTIYSMEGENDRQSGDYSNSNYLGAIAQISVLGALTLFGVVKSWISRAVMILAGIMGLLALVLSGSRGGFLPVGIYAVFYPLWAYGSKLKNKWHVIFPIIITALISSYLWSWISEETFLGQRFESAVSREDNSSEHRIELILIGLDMAFSNPFFGVGLGQFRLHNELGLDAHSEWAELLGTTGLLGFAIYLSMYWVSWRRLQRAIRNSRDSTQRYYCNIAKIILLMLVVTGSTSRPNFAAMEVWFLYGIVIGIGLWTESSNAQLNNKRQAINTLESDGQSGVYRTAN